MANTIFLADKPTQDTINTNIGVSTDANGASTLFGRIRQIWEKVSNLVNGPTASDVWGYGSRTLTGAVQQAIALYSTNWKLSMLNERTTGTTGNYGEVGTYNMGSTGSVPYYGMKQFVSTMNGQHLIQFDYIYDTPPASYIHCNGQLAIMVNGAIVWTGTVVNSYGTAMPSYITLDVYLNLQLGDTVSLLYAPPTEYYTHKCNYSNLQFKGHIKNFYVGYDVVTANGISLYN